MYFISSSLEHYPKNIGHESHFRLWLQSFVLNLIAKAQPNVQYHHFYRTFFKKDCITFLTN